MSMDSILPDDWASKLGHGVNSPATASHAGLCGIFGSLWAERGILMGFVNKICSFTARQQQKRGQL